MTEVAYFAFLRLYEVDLVDRFFLLHFTFLIL